MRITQFVNAFAQEIFYSIIMISVSLLLVELLSHDLPIKPTVLRANVKMDCIKKDFIEIQDLESYASRNLSQSEMEVFHSEIHELSRAFVERWSKRTISVVDFELENLDIPFPRVSLSCHP